MTLEAGAALGPYRITEEIGQGGMATVYKALQPSLHRQVALKVLAEFLAKQPGFRQRFEREAVAVASLEHPNIPAVFDYGEDAGVTYIASRLLEGGTLEPRLGTPLPVAEAAHLLGPIAAALDYAHAQGVLHRDVKPSNIMLTRDGTPMLTDFGLSRLLSEQRLTMTGAVMGTPEYMAPEVCAGNEAVPASDQYALAVVAYQMLTGHVPLTATTPMGVIVAQIQQPPPRPTSINPDLPKAIEKVLLKALAKDPAARYPSNADFVRALEAPGTAAPAPRQRAAAKPRAVPATHRRRSVTALVTATGAVLVVLVGVTGLLLTRAAPSRPRAPTTAAPILGSGSLVNVAGDGTCAYGGDGGPATRAKICQAAGAMAFDAAGNLYFADFNYNRIRKIDTAGTITTIAGTGDLGSAGDGGPAAQSHVTSPIAVAFDPAGNLVILEGGKSRRIRQIGKDGVITTLLDGSNAKCDPTTVLCSGGGAGSTLAIDGSGAVFVGGGNFVWRGTRSGGSLSGTIFAGTPGSAPSATDGEGGPAANASLGNLVSGLAPAPDGSLYITAGQFGVVRRVARDGTISTVAGTGTLGYSGDGGPARSAQTFARNIAVDKHGVLYIADSGNNRVRRVDTSGIITTVAGTGKAGDPRPGTATSSPLTGPVAVAVAPNGDLYVGADNRIVKVLGVASP